MSKDTSRGETKKDKYKKLEKKSSLTQQGRGAASQWVAGAQKCQETSWRGQEACRVALRQLADSAEKSRAKRKKKERKREKTIERRCSAEVQRSSTLLQRHLSKKERERMKEEKKEKCRDVEKFLEMPRRQLKKQTKLLLPSHSTRRC